MDSKQAIHVMTLANSIIGVSILAMPYCFKQCGIILSILLLIVSSIISRLACHFLLKSAIKARLRTFENLAFHVFGTFGKLFVEIGLIGFLLGTCIAFFVVMGDLGPQIIAHMTNTPSSNTLRTSILFVLAAFCVLPLGLLRNVSSLSTVSTATVGFYACLVLKVMWESAPHILQGDWYDKVVYWRPAGILQCIPIFSMALFCQTQLFEIYQAIPNASQEKMNGVVRLAVNICTIVYIFVGVFGYIALSHEPTFSGNILLNFEPSIITELMKMGFVLSVAFSFPLVIFPCRASLFSLLYKPMYSSMHDTPITYIPENKFRLLTVLIILISLTIGIMIPNIELVLGLVGSTIGVIVCVIFPACCFICITVKNTNERLLAQAMLCIGIVVMVLGTYANLYAIEEVHVEKALVMKEIENPIREDIIITTRKAIEMNKLEKEIEKIEEKILEERKEIRHEPPQPEEPQDDSPPQIKEKVETIDLLPEVQKVNVTEKAVVKKEVETKAPEEIKLDIEAIKKEEKELLDSKKEDKSPKLEKMYEEEKKKVEEKDKIITELLHKNEEDKVKAIETIAKLAIEKIVEVQAEDKPIQQMIAKNPESYNIGKQISEQDSQKLKNLGPLPIALSKNVKPTVVENKPVSILQVLDVPKIKTETKQNPSEIVNDAEEKIANIEKTDVKVEETVKKEVIKETVVENKEEKDMRRDILSKDYDRNKRDVGDEQCDDNGKNRSNSGQNIDLEAMDIAKADDTVSLTRDLKSIPNRDGK
ncbi:PREDICTED: putative sodium-coupled neutral amino acid transporter 10 [Nicrophorus vespilloides]|uniref:Sodium-coupled neutral amino acid transporter 10 n=1 Tax=Nicrophorus vespilloides TaxID=110193 RepID=A0ABM1MHN8_NICVS|nr:PREDICTED: putative sodium-coupled neutral amino acid transporter 10 [Nicrophorus vespilloides]